MSITCVVCRQPIEDVDVPNMHDSAVAAEYNNMLAELCAEVHEWCCPECDLAPADNTQFPVWRTYSGRTELLDYEYTTAWRNLFLWAFPVSEFQWVAQVRSQHTDRLLWSSLFKTRKEAMWQAYRKVERMEVYDETTEWEMRKWHSHDELIDGGMEPDPDWWVKL